MGWVSTDLERIAAMSGDTLAAAWMETFAAPVPEVTPSLLRRALAHERQERKFGGLPTVVRKQLESVSAGHCVMWSSTSMRALPSSLMHSRLSSIAVCLLKP